MENIANRNKRSVGDYGYRVDPNTGEVIDTVKVTVDVGSIIYSPEQQKRYRERKQQEAEWLLKQEELKHRRNNSPKFCFITAEEQENSVPPATMARLVYLATFLDYEGNLKMNLHKKMKRSDLETVLRLKKSETYNFWNEVKNTYVFENEHGFLCMCSDFSCKGKLPYKGRYQQVFVNSVQELYCKTSATQHKYLGYVFQMLPFVNVEYNILCSNPIEEELDLIEPITIDGFCSAIGYSKDQRTRLMRVYSNITFCIDGTQEQFCAFVTQGADIGRTKIFVNPHILYHGKKNIQTQILGKLCDFSV